MLFMTDGPGLRVDKNDPFASQEDCPTPAINRRSYRRGVTSLVVRCSPNFLACVLRQGDYARLSAPHIDEKHVLLEQWRSRDAEETGRDLIFFVERATPNLLAVCQIKAMQRSLGAKREHFAIRKKGRRARARIETELIDVASRISKSP